MPIPTWPDLDLMNIAFIGLYIKAVTGKCQFYRVIFKYAHD